MVDYRPLKPSVMRTISHQWLTDPAIRSILEDEPKTAALLPDLEEAHEGLALALGPSNKAELDASIAALREKGDGLDGRHDRKYRGVHYVLEGLIELADNPETQRSLEALRARLQPAGLEIVNESWASESGHAATLRPSLDKTTRAMLRALGSVEGRTLDDEVQQWVKAGEALAPVAAEKAALEAQRDKPEGGHTAARVFDAKLAWVRVVRALESNLDLARNVSESDRVKVLSLLQSVAARTARRGAAETTASEGDAEKA